MHMMLMACWQGDNTPLHWASMRGHVEIVRVLCERSADRSSNWEAKRATTERCRRNQCNIANTRNQSRRED